MEKKDGGRHGQIRGERGRGGPGRGQGAAGEGAGRGDLGQHLGPPGGRHHRRHPVVARLPGHDARGHRHHQPRRRRRLGHPGAHLGEEAAPGLPGRLRRHRRRDPLPRRLRHHVRGGPAAHPELHRRVHRVPRGRGPLHRVRRERLGRVGRADRQGPGGPGRRPDRQPRHGGRGPHHGQGHAQHGPGRAVGQDHLGGQAARAHPSAAREGGSATSPACTTTCARCDGRRRMPAPMLPARMLPARRR